MKPTTGFIGLGAMGGPMAHNLHEAGLLARVWNRSRPRLDAFLAEHPAVAAAETPAALAARATVVISCVSADADLLEVVEQLAPGMTQGSVLVDCSTVSRAAAAAAAEKLAARGADFLDAPVSGGVEGARGATLAMMVGGEAGVLERVRPVLEALAGRISHMGPVGSGQATKAVNQIMAAGINQAVTEALAFAEAEGLPLDRVIEVVASGAAASWFLQHRGPSMVERCFEPGFRVALHHKDLQICQEMAQAFGVSLPVVEMTLIHYRRLMEAGFGDEDISALFRHKNALFD
ncbi:MAG: NAD(P)-dependent oxidoreductase [Gammaproteobacteria bacterium]